MQGFARYARYLYLDIEFGIHYGTGCITNGFGLVIIETGFRREGEKICPFLTEK